MSEVDELEYEYELPLQVVAGLFAGMGWKYDILDEGLMTPDAEVIEALFEGLVESLLESGGRYATLGRLLVIDDIEFPDSHDFYLKVGHCSPKIPEGSR